MLLMRTLSVVLVFLTLISLTTFSQSTHFIRYVNPLIGTEKMGHTFPGATVPFGSVQLSPDTDTIPYAVEGKYNPEVYRYCAGYQYNDPTIVGFSHTHFSGTGHSDLGDLLVMPSVGTLQLNPGTTQIRLNKKGISRKPCQQHALQFVLIREELTREVYLSALRIHKVWFP